MRLIPLVLASLLAATVANAQFSSSGGDITYNLPRAAKVSLNVLNSKGWIVRELLRADQEDAGSHTVHWDGNDQMGRPQPPGTYSWKLLHHTGLKADYVLSVGNSGQPPYRTDDDKGSWGACHGNPMSIQADSSGLYIVWAVEEGNPVFAHTDYDGHSLYKIHNSFVFGRNYDSVINGGTIYRLECTATGSYIEKFNRANGKYLPWDVKGEQVSGIGRLRIEKEARPIPDKKAKRDPNKPDDLLDGKAIAANSTYIAVSFPTLNKIAIFRPSGDQLDELQIDQPHGLLFLPDGRLLVAQPGKIVAVKLADRSVQPFFTQNLDDPWGMALDRDGSSIWVTDQGKSNQVKKFDPSGRLMATFGQPGGMPLEGDIDHLSFYLPRGIACGTDGNIYVTEDSPLRRITRWSPNGKMLREWFGPEGSQLSCWPNLSDFSEVYYQSATKAVGSYGLIQCKVDLQKKTWYPVAWSQINVGVAQPYVFESHGHKFITNHGGLAVYDPKLNSWKRAVQFAHSEKDKSSTIWTDLNGNGQVDDGETQTISDDDLMAKTKLGGLGLSVPSFDTKTFALYGAFGLDPAVAEPSKFTDQGVPIYTFDKIKRLAQQPTRGDDAWCDEGPGYGLQAVIPAEDGGFYTGYNGGRQGRVTDFWDRSAWNYLVKFGTDGRVQWEVGNHATKKPIDPRDMEYIMHMTGIGKHVILLANVQPAKFIAYTDDGLFVDSLMDTGPSLTPNSLTVENVVGLIADDPATHETYLFAGSCEDSRIWHLTGFESFQRLEGSVTLKMAESPSVPATYTIAATSPPREHEPGDFGADGFLNEPEWQQATELPLMENGMLKARVYLRHDDQYLWIGAHVIDPNPPMNSAQDPGTAFAHGDCLDLYFGASSQTSAVHTTGDIGDVRILLYPSGPAKLFNGKIVVTRMKVAAGAEKQPFALDPPANTVTADSIVTIDARDTQTGGGAGHICTFYRWPDGAGYTVEAKIPLSSLPELGLNGAASGDQKIAFDVGVIFSNEAGNAPASRLYWHQQEAKTKTVTDLAAQAQFYPKLWGAAQVGTVIAPTPKP